LILVPKIEARGLDLDFIEVAWEVSAYEGEPSRYEFYLLRSEAEGGPYQVLMGPFSDRYTVRDTAPRLLHQWRTLFYKLRVRDQETGETEDFGPAAKIPKPDLITLEIARQKAILYSEHAGRKCWIFPVRTFGPRCFCYNKTTGQTTRSRCINCFEIGFLGGYLSPVEAYVQIFQAAKQELETIAGKRHPAETQAKLASHPQVKPGDLLVEAENIRWKVHSLQDQEHLRSPVEQVLYLSKVLLGDIAYKIPVKAELSSLSPTAERNFTNPQHAEAGATLDDLFQAFGHSS
jgi:hypothetical protein